MLSSFCCCSYEMLHVSHTAYLSVCAAPGCDPTGLGGGAAALAPSPNRRSSEGGFILGVLRRAQSLCLHSSGVSRAAPACCGTAAVLCLQPGCAGVGDCVLFPPAVVQLLASGAEHRAPGPGLLQPTACLKIRFCSAVGCRTERALETPALRLVCTGPCRGSGLKVPFALTPGWWRGSGAIGFQHRHWKYLCFCPLLPF